VAELPELSVRAGTVNGLAPVIPAVKTLNAAATLSACLPRSA
jgi:hypothetical protein